MNAIAIKEYRYRPNYLYAAIAVAMFLLMALFMFSVAVDNDSGLIIDSLIELSPSGATSFYEIVALGALGGAIAGCYVVYLSLTGRRVITLSPTELAYPSSAYAREISTIPLSSVVRVSLRKVSWRKYFHVQHRLGEVRLSRLLFESEAAFDDFQASFSDYLSRAR
ncbi:hypothetical protein PQR66_09515 [Paraburkholderia agricolaris]|jgi:ABC-type multidrug transport system fused ATPase/permease subunit|uniref:PH domain-containing protein n=1 Tax=Paraburkholderia agricolaris TaxID=2152888 RepID=A0ABW8ZK43_9BURK